MSIILTTNCNECVHKTMCKYKDNAANAMNELKNKSFDTTYIWEEVPTMSRAQGGWRGRVG